MKPSVVGELLDHLLVARATRAAIVGNHEHSLGCGSIESRGKRDGLSPSLRRNRDFLSGTRWLPAAIRIAKVDGHDHKRSNQRDSFRKEPPITPASASWPLGYWHANPYPIRRRS